MGTEKGGVVTESKTDEEELLRELIAVSLATITTGNEVIKRHKEALDSAQTALAALLAEKKGFEVRDIVQCASRSLWVISSIHIAIGQTNEVLYFKGYRILSDYTISTPDAPSFPRQFWESRDAKLTKITKYKGKMPEEG